MAGITIAAPAIPPMTRPPTLTNGQIHLPSSPAASVSAPAIAPAPSCAVSVTESISKFARLGIALRLSRDRLAALQIDSESPRGFLPEPFIGGIDGLWIGRGHLAIDRALAFDPASAAGAVFVERFGICDQFLQVFAVPIPGELLHIGVGRPRDGLAIGVGVTSSLGRVYPLQLGPLDYVIALCLDGCFVFHDGG